MILAAGKGTRFKSRLPKVLHPLCGKPLIRHMLDKVLSLGTDRCFVVVGHEGEAVREALQDYPVEFIEQKEQLGTGHAVISTAPGLSGLKGRVLVVYGDTPLISTQALERLFTTAESSEADQVLLAARYDDPTGYGRILRDSQGEPLDIIEEKDADAEQKRIREINPGFNCFLISSLLPALGKLTNDNRAGEYYLTDLVRLLRQEGKKIVTLLVDNPDETRGINNRFELAEAERKLRAEIARKWMLNGVTLLDPATTYIDETVQIGADTVIFPGVFLQGETLVGSDCTIHSHCLVEDSVIEDSVTLDHCSVVRGSRIGRTSQVGPFAHLREGTHLEGANRLGNFVETKKVRLGEGSKAAHLSYLGDARIGQNVNIGAGTITCNYDGVKKSLTVIEDDVFIGSDSQLVAPVTVHRGAYVGAGSTITEDVPAHSLALARGRQVIKKDWVLERRGKRASDRT